MKANRTHENNPNDKWGGSIKHECSIIVSDDKKGFIVYNVSNGDYLPIDKKFVEAYKAMSQEAFEKVFTFRMSRRKKYWEPSEFRETGYIIDGVLTYDAFENNPDWGIKLGEAL